MNLQLKNNRSGMKPKAGAECRARIISIQSKYNLLDKVQSSKYHILRES